ncbi:MAG: hemerythrin domain-containing protein [Acidobacteria bacterium]|nr:hemerythrin domain-containing protein [Acidobacteriota bacterium]
MALAPPVVRQELSLEPALGSELERFRLQHTALRERLRELEKALRQVRSDNYSQVLQGVATLRQLCPFLQEFDRGEARRVQEVFYRLLGENRPALRGLLGELQSELARYHRLSEDFREALVIFNASGELGRLPALGRELARLLEDYLDAEASSLLPCLAEDTGASWGT